MLCGGKEDSYLNQRDKLLRTSTQHDTVLAMTQSKLYHSPSICLLFVCALSVQVCVYVHGCWLGTVVFTKEEGNSRVGSR